MAVNLTDGFLDRYYGLLNPGSIKQRIYNNNCILSAYF